MLLTLVSFKICTEIFSETFFVEFLDCCQKPIRNKCKWSGTEQLLFFMVGSIVLAMSSGNVNVTSPHSFEHHHQQNQHHEWPDVFYPIDLATNKQYSTHHCVGGHDYMKQAGDRSCVLHKVM